MIYVRTNTIKYNVSQRSILSQYNLCAAGVLGGAAYGIKYKKGVVPMVVAGVTGSVADAIYGYVKACEIEVEAYRKSSD